MKITINGDLYLVLRSFYEFIESIEYMKDAECVIINLQFVSFQFSKDDSGRWFIHGIGGKDN